MKCVQNITTNEVKRVADERASELTQKGWKFVSKLVWKESEGTSWAPNASPANPTSPSKVRRQEMRNRTNS